MEEAEGRQRRLAAALAHAALGEEAAPGLVELGAVLVALRPLQDLGEELRQKRWPWAVAELPPPLSPADQPPAAELLAAARRSAGRLARRLAASRPAAAALFPPWRRPARYLDLAATRLLARIAAASSDCLAAPVRLGLLPRLGLLARARWG
jgi:hypothetical protein